MNEKIESVRQLIKNRQTLKAREMLNEIEKDMERKEALEEFASEVKRRIRSIGRSQHIEISAIDELCIKYSIKFKEKE